MVSARAEAAIDYVGDEDETSADEDLLGREAQELASELAAWLARPRAEPLREGWVRTALAEICGRLGLRRAPGLRGSGEVRTPLVTGLRRPVVLVECTERWEADWMQVVRRFAPRAAAGR